MADHIELLEQAMGAAIAATGAIFVGSGAVPQHSVNPLIVINVVYENEGGNYVAVNSAMPELNNDNQREILLATLTQTIEEIPPCQSSS